MGLLENIGNSALGPTLARADAASLLHGAIRVERVRDGWVRPWRFSSEQLRALGSCQAWHPGLYRQMARATAGICLEFTTDSSEVALEVAIDDEPSGTRAVLDYVDGAEAALPHDGISCDVDGRHLDVRLPREGEERVLFELDDPDEVPLGSVMRLPGMGDTHHVRIWLPCLRGCVLRDVVGNGSVIEAVPARPHLLVLGDSIAQGFVSEDPALAWPAILADRLGLDLVNQGIGGQVFQPGTLFGLAKSVEPEQIVIEFGENYRFEPCRARLVTRDVRSYLLEASRLWPDVDTVVVTPLWHDELAYPSHPLSCFESIPTFLSAHVAPHDQMRLVDGMRLMDHKTSLMADHFEHPGPEGSRQIAERLYLCICARRGSDDGRRARALEELSRAPRRTFPLAELARRGRGEVVLAQDGCVLMRDPGGMQLLWSRDRELGRSVVEALVEPTVVDCLEPALVRDVELAHALTVVLPYHLAIYEKKTPIEVDAERDIRRLDDSFFDVVRSTYSHPEYKTDDEVRELLRSGRVWGGFVEGELVGYIGEHPVGSMGMLEVFPEWRRQGWGYALEATLINETLRRGETPWCEVYPDNKASIRLQKKLGLKVTPANEQCYLGASRETALQGVASRGADQ
ncbi:MAG: GNAT family N-acetyltransferase [Olsenella sp.]|nr:GNAT family N-acetyltransferase [Olsenella sp.]